MDILVIDARGGGIGRQLVAAIKQKMPEVFITAVGTNSIATEAMIKAGANNGATGENAVVVGCRKADVIIGPVGVVIADSMDGEITPQMAVAVAQSHAKRILIPFRSCNNIVIGISDCNIKKLIQDAIIELQRA